MTHDPHAAAPLGCVLQAPAQPRELPEGVFLNRLLRRMAIRVHDRADTEDRDCSELGLEEAAVGVLRDPLGRHRAPDVEAVREIGEPRVRRAVGRDVDLVVLRGIIVALSPHDLATSINPSKSFVELVGDVRHDAGHVHPRVGHLTLIVPREVAREDEKLRTPAHLRGVGHSRVEEREGRVAPHGPELVRGSLGRALCALLPLRAVVRVRVDVRQPHEELAPVSPALRACESVGGAGPLSSPPHLQQVNVAGGVGRPAAEALVVCGQGPGQRACLRLRLRLRLRGRRR
mmetsp:Transcript_64595/g.169103  ORF Transcript_64595/g.169103 Transcript_64595/m.169103 type:complete len:288 (+) Transcript_64595:886-1749(+)